MIRRIHLPGKSRVCLCALSLCRLRKQAACISQQPLLQPLPGLHQPLPLRVQQRCLLHPTGKHCALIILKQSSFCQTIVRSDQEA